LTGRYCEIYAAPVSEATGREPRPDELELFIDFWDGDGPWDELVAEVESRREKEMFDDGGSEISLQDVPQDAKHPKSTSSRHGSSAATFSLAELPPPTLFIGVIILFVAVSLCW
jgi:hypothetical protein